MEKPRNPYVIGNSVGNSVAFVGRDDILKEVLNVLGHHQHNALVLFGQRRIGKTSVLQELKARLPQQGLFLSVLFDLQDKSRWPLEKVLRELAHKINECLPNQINADLGKEPEKNFREVYLPKILKELASEQSLVLLFDEFDVLATSDEIEQPASAAFFPYLRQLLTLNSQQLNFVFAIGRKIEDVNNSALSLFKDIITKRVSLLKKDDTIKLIRLSETNNSLNWSPEAIETVWQQTNGHPYLTQCLGYCIWNLAYEHPPKQTPHITPDKVMAAIPDTLERSESAFEWLWDGLGYADRVVAAALAISTKHMTETQLKQFLKENGLPVIFQELRDAPRILQKWDLIEQQTEGSYCFRVELLRRWIADNKPLYREQEELDRLDPEADKLYETAKNLYKRPNLEAAIDSLYQAIKINQHHVGAHLLLADIFIEKRQFEKAREILEQLYVYQPLAASNRLIEVLLTLAPSNNNKEEQRKLYERILELEPEQQEAKSKIIHLKKDRTSEKATKNQQITELHNLLNYIVTTENEIDAVFVYDLANSFVLYSGTTKEGRFPELVDTLESKETGTGNDTEALASFGEIRNVKETVEEFANVAGRGKFKCGVYMLTKGLLNVYFEQLKKQTIAIAFVSGTPEGLGKFVFYCEDYIEDIRRKLGEIHN